MAVRYIHNGWPEGYDSHSAAEALVALAPRRAAPAWKPGGRH